PRERATRHQVLRHRSGNRSRCGSTRFRAVFYHQARGNRIGTVPVQGDRRRPRWYYRHRSQPNRTWNLGYLHFSGERDGKTRMSQSSVLVVEDNDLEREITTETLRDEGFAVEQAATGKRAMELLGPTRFDVVLTDLMMPGMSGEELLDKVRTTYPSCQVVILTA